MTNSRPSEETQENVTDSPSQVSPGTVIDEQTIVNYEESEQGKKEPTDFFISHASKGEGVIPGVRKLVLDFVKWLDGHGYKMFFDKNNVYGSFVAEIEIGLNDSKYIIAMCSPRYKEKYKIKTSWVRKEMEHFLIKEADSGNYKIIIVLLGVSVEDIKSVMPLLSARIPIIAAQSPDQVKSIDINKIGSEVVELVRKFTTISSRS